MAQTLEGRTIALAEGRQLEELVLMLEKEGATTLRCPMLSILDAPDPAPVLAWLRQLIAGQFDWVVLLTGEGFRRLLGCAERADLRSAMIEALGRVRTVVRGPKPGKALKEVGLVPTLTAEAPTTEGVIATLRRQALQGQSIGVQLYAETNPPLLDFLASAGAKVHTVLPYIYAPKADGDRILELIEQMSLGKVDVLVFTSSPQIERLFEVASERNLADSLKQGLQKTRVAAVGPIVAETLRHHAVEVAICPEQGFVMKNLVSYIKRAFAEPV